MADDINTLKKRIDELEEITRLAESLGGASSVEEILGKIVEASLRLCQARRVAILLFSPFTKEVLRTLVRSSEQSETGIDHGLNLIIAGWIEHHGRPLLTSDIVHELELKSPGEQWQDCGSVLAVPLMSAGRTIGILNLVNPRGGMQFTQESLRLAVVIATFASQFITRARLHESLFEENLRLKTVLQAHHGVRGILGSSRAIKEILQKISTIASSDASVLLVGETGTGKELVARAIHFQSPRADKAFVAINCSAIPAALFESELFGHERGSFTGATNSQKGKFELAHQGTLFLDEIGEMPLDMQPKLLRILEERSFYRLGSSTELESDVRVIAATGKDLSKSISEGTFREDLYHRLSVLPLHLPPLRDRPEDIAILAQTFLQEFSRGTKHLSPDALEFLQELPWKGNVRELRNTVERASIYLEAKEIGTPELQSLDINIGAGTNGQSSSYLKSLLRNNEQGADLLETLEKQLVRLTLDEAKGNVSYAAKLLGIDRNALQRRIEKYQLPKEHLSH
jgi:transcriptional regulator with GAF, ATPase, and Fis domain